MKKNVVFIAFVAWLLATDSVFAQFSVSAEIRPRAEMNNGAMKPLADTVSTFYYISQRSRINLDYARDKYQMRISIQDVRVWGSGDIYTSTGVFGSTMGIDVYEAWFRLKIGSKSNITIGRQELNLDDQRIFSSRNWNQFGLTYDALVYNFNTNGLDMHAMVSYNNRMDEKTGFPVDDTELFNDNNRIKTLNFIHVRKKFNENISGSAMVVGTGFQNESQHGTIYLTGTYGLWAAVIFNQFDALVNLYFQNGHAQTGKEVSAYLFSLNPGYSIGKFRIGAGIDYLSGDDANSSNFGKKEKTFNKFYGAVFKFYGLMNYFSYMKSSTKNGGLVDIYPSVKLSINKKHLVNGTFHLFSLANAIKTGETVVEDKNLGSELDLMYTYKAGPELNIKCGFSYYFDTETLRKVKGASDNYSYSPYWAWVMVTFTPRLFSSEK